MTAQYKLCWHGKFVYKFVLEWPPDGPNMLDHERDIIATIVQAVCRHDFPRKLSNGELIAEIERREWKLSGQMVFERDGAMYELYRHQFHVRVQRSDVVARSADGIRHRYNNEGGSSSEDSLAPVKQKWPSRKVKRKIRLPAIYRRRNTPPSRAVVHRQTKSDLELAPPFLVQDCLRYVRAKDAGQRLVVKQYCIPDIIYRALQQYANISEDQNDNSAIVFLHDSVSLVGGGPQAIQFAQSSDATTNTGLFQSIKRGVATVLGKMSKWMA